MSHFFPAEFSLFTARPFGKPIESKARRQTIPPDANHHTFTIQTTVHCTTDGESPSLAELTASVGCEN